VRLNRRSAAKLLVALAFLAGLRIVSSAGAERYPGKPVRIIVPYTAGGPYDGIPRIIAQWISARHGWSIVIENRSGATGVIGVMAAKQAAPDGHTLVVLTTSSMPALKRNLAYDPIKDFAPIVTPGRQRAIHDHQHRRGDAAHRQRQATAACDHRPQALAAAAQCADDGGARLSRL
jgi:tripartite-type tricarboxylate transporter receptor subunit TctC